VTIYGECDGDSSTFDKKRRKKRQISQFLNQNGEEEEENLEKKKPMRFPEEELRGISGQGRPPVLGGGYVLENIRLID